MQLVAGQRTEVDAVEQIAGVADAAAADHRGHVGDTHQLCRRAVQPCALGRADPDADGDGCIGNALHQLAHLLVRDDGPTRVDLQDERLRTVSLGTGDGLIDGVDHHPVEQTRHLQHVDRRQARIGDRIWRVGRDRAGGVGRDGLVG